MEILPDDINDLKYAKALLDNLGLAAKITNALGAPIERGFDFLSEGWYGIVNKSTGKALNAAINYAILTMDKRSGKSAANTFHKLMVAGAGVAGGFWGLPALAMELPISTTVMLRSIADIARSEGHDITDPMVKVACIEVFAFGGPSKRDDGVETGYFAIRTALAKAVNDAAKHIAAKGFADRSAPVFVRLVSQISSRLGVQVTEKIAAQSIPVLGAAGGAVINTLFIDHFQNMARGHFIVLRLEQKYDQATIRELYASV